MANVKIKLLDGTYQDIDGNFGVLCFGTGGYLKFSSKSKLLSELAGQTQYLQPVENAEIYNFEHSQNFEQYISGVTNGVIYSSGVALSVHSLISLGSQLSSFVASIVSFYKLEEPNGNRIDSKNSLTLYEAAEQYLILDSNSEMLYDLNGEILTRPSIYSSTINYTSGVLGSGANFTGNAYLSSSSVPTHDYTKGLSMAAWLNFDTGQSYGIGGRPSEYSYESGDYSLWHEPPYIHFRIYDTTSGGYIGRKFSFSNGLGHLCVTWDGSNNNSSGISGFRNAQYVTSSDDSNGSFSSIRNTYPVSIGRVPKSGKLFSGMMDQFIIFNSGIYSGAVVSLYGSGAGKMDSELL